MRYIDQHTNANIEEIKNALKEQFNKPNSYSQIVDDMKDFKQGPSESMWDFDRRLKKVIREGGFQYDDRKHTERFIAMLLPHLRIPMVQQSIET